MLNSLMGLFNYGNSSGNDKMDISLGYNSAGEEEVLRVSPDTLSALGIGNTDINTKPSGLFGLSNNTLGALGLGLQGLSGLAGAYMGMKNLEFAKDQFNFQKGLANRNLANQAKIINNQYDNAAQVAAGMVGGRDSSGNFGYTSQSTVDRYANNAQKKHVDGSPIM